MNAKPPVPTWITVLGVFLVLFGATVLFRGAGTLTTPWVIDMQKAFFGNLQHLVGMRSTNYVFPPPRGVR